MRMTKHMLAPTILLLPTLAQRVLNYAKRGGVSVATGGPTKSPLAANEKSDSEARRQLALQVAANVSAQHKVLLAQQEARRAAMRDVATHNLRVIEERRANATRPAARDEASARAADYDHFLSRFGSSLA